MTKEPEPKGFRVELPDRERGRSPADLARLDVLNARLSRPPKARGRMSADDARQADMVERAELERRPHVVAEREWAKRALAETADLATARGEDFHEKPSGGLEIHSRDPLRRLLVSGKLSPDQHEAGVAIRDCYEARSEDVGSQMGELTQAGGAHDNHRFVATRFTRAMATDRAQAVEIAVLTGNYRLRDGSFLRIKAWNRFAEPEMPPPHVALTVLRNICAQNIGLTEQGRGRAFEWNSRALILALDIAYECLMGGRGRKA